MERRGEMEREEEENEKFGDSERAVIGKREIVG